MFFSDLKLKDQIQISKKKKLNALFITVQQFVFNSEFVFNLKFVFNFFFVIKIFKEFRKFINKNYQNESIWIKIRKIIVKTSKNEIKISFYEENELIYFNEKRIINNVLHRRLCLSQTALKETFRLVHNEFHFDFHKCYELFFFVYYIRDLTASLKAYLKHCLNCQINQIQKYKSHEFFQSIQFSLFSFHIIVMNFILIFFQTKKKLNCAMSVTCKFFKKIILISEKMIWKTKNWIKTFLIRLDIMNWKLFKQIINDRDRKFLSEFWIAFFTNFEIRFFYNTTYHFQIDEQFERIN